MMGENRLTGEHTETSLRITGKSNKRARSSCDPVSHTRYGSFTCQGVCPSTEHAPMTARLSFRHTQVACVHTLYTVQNYPLALTQPSPIVSPAENCADQGLPVPWQEASPSGALDRLDHPDLLHTSWCGLKASSCGFPVFVSKVPNMRAKGCSPSSSSRPVLVPGPSALSGCCDYSNRLESVPY